MTTEKVKRKLTAILSADVKGYSRLMGADEVGTIHLLQTYRGVMCDLILKKGGRVIDSPGDNVLAEFASVVDALESAVEIQKELKVRNADRSESRRMEFRIGINLGDVVEEGERIYGDGVNIAARIEGLAEGGGVCISGTAFDHIGKRLPLGYEYMGEQPVKNIEKPVRVYRVLTEPEQAGKVIGEKGPRRTRWGWTAAAVTVLVLAVGGLVWNFYWRAPKIEPASVNLVYSDKHLVRVHAYRFFGTSTSLNITFCPFSLCTDSVIFNIVKRNIPVFHPAISSDFHAHSSLILPLSLVSNSAPGSTISSQALPMTPRLKQ